MNANRLFVLAFGAHLPVSFREPPMMPAANKVRLRGGITIAVPSQEEAEAFCRAKSETGKNFIERVIAGTASRRKRLAALSSKINSRRLIAQRKKAARRERYLDLNHDLRACEGQ